MRRSERLSNLAKLASSDEASRADSGQDGPDVDVARLYDEIMSLWPDELAKYKPNREDAPLNHQYYMHGLRKFDGKTRRPNMIVIAESPAQTPKEIVGSTAHLAEEAFHCGHTNLVSCISYGEGWVLEEAKKQKVAVSIRVQGRIVTSEKLQAEVDIKKPSNKKGTKAPNNKGTPIFWKVLSCLALQQSDESLCAENFNSAFSSLGGGKAKREQRLAVKIDILNKLDELGMCLVDISPVSVYLGAGSKRVKNQTNGNFYNTPAAFFKSAQLKAILNHSWTSYLKKILEYYRPRSILVLGKRVGDAIGHNEILNVTREIGDVEYLGILDHPSSRSLPGEKYLPQYRFISRNAYRVVRKQQQTNDDDDKNIPTLDDLKHQLALEKLMTSRPKNTKKNTAKENTVGRSGGKRKRH